MFERFTHEARQVVVTARDRARDLGHPYVGTEHILLALLDPHTGIPFAVLTDAGLTADRVRVDVAALVKSATPKADEPLSDDDADALEAIGIDLRAVRAKIEEAFGPGALDPPPTVVERRGLFGRRGGKDGTPAAGRLPFTRRSKTVLELSLREAINLKHNYIGSEHILLGMLREGEGLATKVIHDADIDLAALRRQVLAAIPRAA
jgi:ATP-dependent Clp protease ATP-binding subunit ClpA